MKSRVLIITILSGILLLLVSGCKKDRLEPVNRSSVGIYYWFTLDNTVYAPHWLRKNDNTVWTWYDAIYKVFDPHNRLTGELNTPAASVYLKGGNGADYFSSAMIINNNNQLETAYLSQTKEGADSTWNYSYLRTAMISENGVVTQGKKTFVHYSYYNYLSGFKFIKTSSNYYFAYVLTVQDSSILNGNPYFEDSLVMIKTDLNLNIINRTQMVTSDPDNAYLSATIFDLQLVNDKLYLTRYSDLGGYEMPVFETFDNDLNLLNSVRLEDMDGTATTWTNYYYTLQKILYSQGRIIVVGDRQQGKTANRVLCLTYFDLLGNYLYAIDLKTEKPYSLLNGVEPCSDGKFLLYYTESDDASFSPTSIGVVKIDAGGNGDYILSFPGNDPSKYYPCMAYENGDGTVSIYGYSVGQQASQTLFVKMDTNGKIK